MFSFPIGVSRFEEIKRTSSQSIYLDKTLLIYEIFSSGSKVMLFTRPIRFMKSTNLSMIAAFCDLQTSKANAPLFDGLAIKDFTHPERQKNWDDHFGQYPVVLLSLKGIPVADGYKISEHFQKVIANLYRSHRYLVDSGKIFPEDKKDFRAILERKNEEIDYENALFFLSRCLYEHYGKQAIILIDEYDTPLHHAHLYDEEHQLDEGSDKSCFEATRRFLLNFLKAGLKDNPYLHKGIMTGVLRTAFGSLVSELNNVDVLSVLNPSPRFAPYFGVTDADIDFLMDTLKISEHSQVRDILRSTYNGYSIAGVTLYNPWSVMHYLRDYTETQGQSVQGRPYWLQTGDSSIVGVYLRKHYADVYPQMMKLLNLEPLQVTLDERSRFSNVKTSSSSIFWGVLLQCGYLTTSAIQDYRDSVARCEVRIPNNEVYGAFIHHVQQLLAPQRAQDMNLRFTDAILQGHYEDFAAHLQAYLTEVVSYFDIQKMYAPGMQEDHSRNALQAEGAMLPEAIYHVLVMGVIAGLHQAQYLLLSNRESGKGRHDLILLPLASERPGIVFEFKKTDAAKGLENSAQQALEQIKQKDYAKIFESYGVQHGIHIGLAFSGKQLCLRHETARYKSRVPFRLREPIGEVVHANGLAKIAAREVAG